MKEPTEQFERLVSRFLDGECSAAQRRELQSEIRKDANAESYFEETSSLDREFGRVIRGAIARPAFERTGQPRWIRMIRAGVLSAAACLGWIVWRPDGSPATAANPGLPRTHFASWFAPHPILSDTFSQQARPDRPELLLDQSDHQWIVVPGQKAGEFLVVEVKCVRTRKIPVQGDF